MIGNILLAALCCFFKRNNDICLNIRAASRSIRIRSASRTAEAAAKEAVENISEIKAARTVRISAAYATAEIGVNPGKAKLVIPCALILIGKHLVGLVCLLKLNLGVLIARVQVRVILFRNFSVCFFYLVIRSTLLYTEHFIIVSLIVRHPLSSPRNI